MFQGLHCHVLACLLWHILVYLFLSGGILICFGTLVFRHIYILFLQIFKIGAILIYDFYSVTEIP